jgi:hypothetical protein
MQTSLPVAEKPRIVIPAELVIGGSAAAVSEQLGGIARAKKKRKCQKFANAFNSFLQTGNFVLNFGLGRSMTYSRSFDLKYRSKLWRFVWYHKGTTSEPWNPEALQSRAGVIVICSLQPSSVDRRYHQQ